MNKLFKVVADGIDYIVVAKLAHEAISIVGDDVQNGTGFVAKDIYANEIKLEEVDIFPETGMSDEDYKQTTEVIINTSEVPVIISCSEWG